MINQAETGSGPIHAFKHENKQTNLFLFPPAIISRRGALKPIGSISHGHQGKLPMSSSTEFCNLTLSLHYFRLQLWAVVLGLKKLHCSTFQFLWRNWVLFCFVLIQSNKHATKQSYIHKLMDLDRLACPEQPIELENRWERSRCSTSRTQISHCSINGAQKADKASSLRRIYLWEYYTVLLLEIPEMIARQGLGVQGKLKKLDPWSQSMKQNRDEHRKTKTKIKADSKGQIAWTTQKPLEGEQKTRARCCPSRNQRGIMMCLMLWF